MLYLHIVKQGQRVVVWDAQGQVKIIDGPRRLYLWRQRIQELPRFSARADEYLAVEFQDGHVEHLQGPNSIWLDPVQHKSVEVEKALPIDSHEAVVVYERINGEVKRRIVHGPAMYVPSEKEWLHRFRWHGADRKDPTRKIPRALDFVKLRVIPDQMYFDVEGVRTSDDALVVIKLMVFLNLTRLRRGLVIPAQAGIHEPPNSVWITEILDPGLRRGDTL